MNGEGHLDLEAIRALIQLATESEIAELEVELPNVKVRIRKTPSGPPNVVLSNPTNAGAAATAAAADHAPAGQATAVPPGEAGYTPIVAPMVGTFYRSPKPGAPPYVNEGDAVQAGQTVCVLEAMKLFNEIPSEIAGRIVRILVENGTPVEYGQPLFLVDPAPPA
jgi:acetyl-CoA carboxylase biotin carboxyl carrier protein